jgi:Leucine Rich Repeat
MNAPRDYISNLPDEILTSILALLSTKEAVQSSFLAKRWSKIWTFLPGLKFDLEEFLTDNDINEESQKVCEDKFELFVNYVLENRGTSKLHSIQYKSVIYNNYSESSMQWLDRATVLRPRVVSVSVSRENEFDCCPDLIFSCISLEKLELIFDTNNRTIVKLNSINLPCLKFLKLRCVEFDDGFVPKLLSGCPSLRSLYLSVCDFRINAICHISSNVLKELILDQCWHPEQIQISCPSLEYLFLDCDDEEGGFSLENMASLMNAEFGFALSESVGDLNLLRGLSNVSTLRLQLRDTEFQV